MTESNIDAVFAQLNVSRILVAVIESLEKISIPVDSFINAVNEDKELQVDYDKDNQTFTFSVRVKNNEEATNDTE